MPELPRRALSIGPLGERFPDVHRIAVLRGGGLGDLLFAMPAIRSLAAAYPEAEIVLLGTPLHRALLEGRPGPVDSVLTLPVAKGIHEPHGAVADADATRRFFDEATRKPVDLAAQLHGGGGWSNPFLRRLGARWTIGGRAEDAQALDRALPFQYFQHETLRWLEVAGLAGAPPVELEPSIAVTAADLAEAEAALARLPRPLVTLHPGATDPRRRWPVSKFRELIVGLAGRAGIAVVGTDAEAALVHEISAGLPARALAGQLSLSGLVGVLASSAAVVANDSGPRHLAQAVGTDTVSIYWMINLLNAGPLGRSRNGVHISWTARCPVCGADCTRQDLGRCEHDVSFVGDVETDAVLADVLARLP